MTAPLWTAAPGEDPAKQHELLAQMLGAFYNETLRVTRDVELARELTIEYQRLMLETALRPR